MGVGLADNAVSDAVVAGTPPGNDFPIHFFRIREKKHSSHSNIFTESDTPSGNDFPMAWFAGTPPGNDLQTGWCTGVPFGVRVGGWGGALCA